MNHPFVQPDAIVFAGPMNDTSNPCSGIPYRAYLAGQIMAAIFTDLDNLENLTPGRAAEWSVERADALIHALNTYPVGHFGPVRIGPNHLVRKGESIFTTSDDVSDRTSSTDVKVPAEESKFDFGPAEVKSIYLDGDRRIIIEIDADDSSSYIHRSPYGSAQLLNSAPLVSGINNVLKYGHHAVNRLNGTPEQWQAEAERVAELKRRVAGLNAALNNIERNAIGSAGEVARTAIREFGTFDGPKFEHH